MNMNISWILFLIVCSHKKAFASESRSFFQSFITPKYINKAVENILPLFLPSNNDVESRKFKSTGIGKAIEGFQDSLKTSAQSDEGWLTFGKRLAGLALTGSNDVSKDIFNADLAKKLYENSPQFIKDSLRAHTEGSVVPVLKERIADIIKTMKENMTTRTVDAEGKQIVFDPVVFGVNSMLNLLYIAAFNAAVMPTMGIDNLFYPDYSFDYDSLTEDEEELAEEDDYYYDDYEDGQGHKGHGHKGQDHKGHDHKGHDHKGQDHKDQDHKGHDEHIDYEDYDEHEVLDHVQGHKIHLPVKEGHENEHIEEQEHIQEHQHIGEHQHIQEHQQNIVTHQAYPQVHQVQTHQTPQQHPQGHQGHTQMHQEHQVHQEQPQGHQVHQEQLQVHQEHTQMHQEHPPVHQEHPQIHQEHTQMHQKHTQMHQEHTQIHQEHTQMHQEHTQMHQEHPPVHQEHPQIHQEHTQMHQEHTQMHQEPAQIPHKQKLHQSNIPLQPSQFESSYMYYPGQRLQLPTINHISSNPTISKNIRNKFPKF